MSSPTGPVLAQLFLPFWVGALAVAAIAVFSLAGLVSLVAYWPRGFELAATPASLRDFVTSDEREIKLIVVDAMLTAYAANGVWLARKVQLFRFAFALAAIAAGMLGASVIIEVLQFTRGWSEE